MFCYEAFELPDPTRPHALMSKRLVRLLVVALALAAPPVLAASPPVQPKTGPGSAGDAAGEVVRRGFGRSGAATFAYHLATPATEARPVVVFLHAWGAGDPLVYGGWIEQLARRGHLVLFPTFQEIGRTRPADATANAATLVRDALAALAADPAARPDLARVAFIGHSAGAGVAVNLAAVAKARELPVPRLVFAVMPGGVASDAKSRGVPLEDLSVLDGTTAIVTVVGDRESQAADRTSRRILREASNVPLPKKLFVRAGSDDHGFPTLSATLASPGSTKAGYEASAVKLPPEPPVDRRAPRPLQPRWSADMVLSGEQTILLGQLQRNVTDTLDYLAFWKTFDMAAAAAFAGADMASVRTDPAFLDMGRWSDGWPVRRLVGETPKAETAPAVTKTVVPMAATKLPVTRSQRAPRNARTAR